MIKIAVIGSRKFRELDKVERYLDDMKTQLTEFKIITGRG